MSETIDVNDGMDFGQLVLRRISPALKRLELTAEQVSSALFLAGATPEAAHHVMQWLDSPDLHTLIKQLCNDPCMPTLQRIFDVLQRRSGVDAFVVQDWLHHKVESTLPVPLKVSPSAAHTLN